MKECEKYKLDITDYATGETTFLTKAKQQQLFDHLRKCASCRAAYFETEKIYNLDVTQAQMNRPAYRKKMDALLEQFRKEPIKRVSPEIKPIPGEEILDPEEHIGNFAGQVWQCLAKNGRIKESDLARKVKLPVRTFDRAIGWLAGEKKIHQTRVKQTNYVYLTEQEQNIYQQEQAQI